MNYNNILTKTRNAIRYITINRPKQLNALNAETIAELNAAILAAEKDKLVYYSEEKFLVHCVVASARMAACSSSEHPRSVATPESTSTGLTISSWSR